MVKLCVALDVEKEKALKLVEDLKDYPVIFKVGYKLFIPYGVEIVRELQSLAPNNEIFLDLKLHDIPNTVANGVRGADILGIQYLTLHALGGKEMLKRANEVKGKVKTLGVTLLTSHDKSYLEELGTNLPKDEFVLKLAGWAIESGCDGLVCSAHEVEILKRELKKEFIAVVPGIRLDKNSVDDQKRVATPEEAVQKGADILVVGRPIVRAENPKKVVEEILKRIS
jgi:orotidine-5'-phosphate decarboxylase